MEETFCKYETMNVKLLSNLDHPVERSRHLDDDLTVIDKPLRRLIAFEIMRIGWPVCLQWLANFGRSIISYALLARYSNEDDLAGFVLGNMLTQATGIFPCYGLGGAFDTFPIHIRSTIS